MDSGDSNSNDLWIRSFLKRNWSVSPETIFENVKSAIGVPLLLDQNKETGRIVHPVWNSRKSAPANLSDQERKAIGVVEKVFYNPNDNTFYADSRVTDPTAREWIRQFHGKKLPIYVSPQIIYDPKTEQPNGPYKQYRFSHLAVISAPAYDPSQAQIIGVCSGDEKTYHEKLQQATMTPPSPGAAASASASLGSEYIFNWRSGFSQQEDSGCVLVRLAILDMI